MKARIWIKLEYRIVVCVSTDCNLCKSFLGLYYIMYFINVLKFSLAVSPRKQTKKMNKHGLQLPLFVSTEPHLPSLFERIDSRVYCHIFLECKFLRKIAHLRMHRFLIRNFRK